MMFIKTFAISALFFLTASTSVALANDIAPIDPQGTVIELDAGSTSNASEQVTETSTESVATDANNAVIEDLRSLNEMARQHSLSAEGWQ